MAFSLSSLSQEIEAIAEKTNRKSVAYLSMIAGHCFLPKESEDKPYGEDAFFLSDDHQTIGVADGVGGYAEHGIDSGVYARQLMAYASHFVNNHNYVDPMAALIHAFQNTKVPGASTACIITLRGSILRAVNVGDSGFRVLRAGKVIYTSPVQQSYFNCPFQLGGGNSPSDADELRFEVELGDVIVAATDGVFDNMFDEELEYLVQEALDNKDSAEVMAKSVGRMARKASLYDDEVSPFSLAAKKAGWASCIGGKYDDVTVVVGYVRQGNMITWEARRLS